MLSSGLDTAIRKSQEWQLPQIQAISEQKWAQQQSCQAWMEEELRGPDLSLLHYFLLTNSRRGEFRLWLQSDWWTPQVPVGVYNQMLTESALVKAKESQKIKPRVLHMGKELLVMVNRTNSDEKEEREGKKETLIAIYCLHA